MQKSTHPHPLVELAQLLVYSLLGGFIFSFLGLIIYAMTSDVDLLSLLQVSESGMDLNFLKTLQIFSSIGIFIAGPLAFAAFNKYKSWDYFHFNQPIYINLILLVLGIMLCGLPLLEWLASLNQKMALPEFLKGIENWMRIKEDEAAKLTKQLLVMKSYGDFALNIFMIAIIPAIGEELLFRGGMQNIFARLFKNKHLAIWVTAIIFSAIHVQFFGFFPRMLLGVLFGYLLVWGKSIWLPILAHFINNGLAVTIAFIMQEQGKNMDEIEKVTAFPMLGYILSAIISLVLLVKYYQYSKKEMDGELYG
jgi:membrane protease YdiL (CAAX protease family)